MDIVQGGMPYPEFKIEFIRKEGWGGTRVEKAVGGIGSGSWFDAWGWSKLESLGGKK